MESPSVSVPVTLSNQDAAHLSVLAICYYVLAGFTFIFGFIPIIYLVIGMLLLTNSEFIVHPDDPMTVQFETHEEMQEAVLFGEGETPLRVEKVEVDQVDQLDAPQETPPEEEFNVLGGVLTGISAMATLVIWALAAMFASVGRSLQKRKSYGFCQVVAGISCLCVPVGTILGVFTIVVLQRPAIAAAFKRS